MRECSSCKQPTSARKIVCEHCGAKEKRPILVQKRLAHFLRFMDVVSSRKPRKACWEVLAQVDKRSLYLSFNLSHPYITHKQTRLTFENRVKDIVGLDFLYAIDKEPFNFLKAFFRYPAMTLQFFLEKVNPDNTRVRGERDLLCASFGADGFKVAWRKDGLSQHKDEISYKKLIALYNKPFEGQFGYMPTSWIDESNYKISMGYSDWFITPYNPT